MKSLLVIAALVLGVPAFADSPVVEDARASRDGSGWRIDVTLSHPDTGWDHYADGWRVLTPDRQEIGMRVLHHPHVNEQPFTRSLGGVAIPGDLKSVLIQSRCSEHGWSEAVFEVQLPAN